MDIKLILKKIENQKLTDKEEEVFKQWYSESEEHRAFYERIKNGVWIEEDEIAVEEAWLEVERKLKERARKRKFNYYMAVASVAVLLLIGSVLVKTKNETVSSKPPKSVTVNAADTKIEAGTDKATLTLADGSVVTLQKNNFITHQSFKVEGDELHYEKESTEAEIELKYNILHVPKGGQYTVVLSDGTKVWLNSDTQLKYPVNFRKGEPRTVELLYGEAFFAVSSSALNNGDDFEVRSSDQLIEVKGTDFNVTNYQEDDSIATTLITGSVWISLSASSQKMALEPGNQMIYSKDNANWEIKKEVDTELITAWKEGYFKFKNKSLQDIMNAISRWYDVKANFENEDLKDIRFNGVFNKNQKLEDILDILITDGSLSYTVDGREITIKNPE